MALSPLEKLPEGDWWDATDVRPPVETSVGPVHALRTDTSKGPEACHVFEGRWNTKRKPMVSAVAEQKVAKHSL